MFLTQDDRRISLIGGSLMAGLTLAAGISVYFVMQKQIESVLSTGLEASVQSKAHLFESQFQKGLADVQAVVTRPFLIQSLQQIDTGSGHAVAVRDLQRQADSLLLANFSAAAIYDSRGTEIVQAGRTSRSSVPTVPLNTTNAASFLLWDEDFILRVRMDVLDQQGQRIGSVTTEEPLLLLTNAFNTLKEIGRSETKSIGKTGELLLCAPWAEDGQEMACFLGGAASKELRRLPRVIGGAALPMNYALKGQRGIIAAKDYRQVAVIAAYTPIGTHGLGLVLKLNVEELHSAASGQLKVISGYLAALVVAGMLLLHWLVMPLVRKLVRSERAALEINANLLRAKENAERYSAELAAYNEAIGELALVSVTDRSGRILQANAKFCKVCGYSEQELLGQDHRILNSGTHPKAFFVKMWETIARGTIWHQEICNRSKSAKLYWVDSTIVPLKDSSGRVERYLSVRVDITARKQKEIGLRERLKESVCLYEIRRNMLPQLSIDEICQQIIAHLIPAMQFPQITAVMIECEGRQFVSANYSNDLTHGLRAEITVDGRSDGQLQVFYREDKPFLLPEEQNLIDAVTDDLGRWLERKQAGQRIMEMATHDALTGLPNRLLLLDRITQTLAQDHRSQEQAAVLFIDLDHFKVINDSLGHDMGDLLLKEVAARLVSSVRGEDTVARQGGDEFIVVLHSIASAQDAGAVAQKILDALIRPYYINGKELHIGSSIGITVFPDDGEDVDTLLKNSDAAMYHAKESGRNNYQFFTPKMNRLVAERHALETDLRHALERDELRLYFQPVVSMPGDKLKSMEVLLRWQHPELGLLPPLKFIALAEENGLIVPIGEWVLKMACLQIKAWQEQGYEVPRLAVNLSARQFQHKTLVADITHILAETGVAARCLTLEITESILVQNVDEVIGILNQLSALGLEISIDDFGTGYSSLSYLKRYPINTLKIDRAFVRDIATDPNDAAIIAAIIAMARSLKMGVIAEGVETEEQLAFLTRQGCSRYQGYYFSQPLPAAEIVGRLQRT